MTKENALEDLQLRLQSIAKIVTHGVVHHLESSES